MARRDGAGVRLITRHGNDFTSRFPFIVAAVTALPRLGSSRKDLALAIAPS
jgi:ATP-dependent DNA ligase